MPAIGQDGGVARVTLQTIADRLGVSRTTVSNAYNRPDQLGDELRARIMAAADELGYRGPDLAARSLRTGRTGTIGLVFTEDLRFVFTDPDTTHFIQGVAETAALARTGLTMLPVPVGFDVHESALMAAPVDGYLLFSVAGDHPAVDVVRSRGVPTVVVDEPDLGEGAFVGIDDRAGARLAADHVLALGHRRGAGQCKHGTGHHGCRCFLDHHSLPVDHLFVRKPAVDRGSGHAVRAQSLTMRN